MSFRSAADWQVHDPAGRRKYVNGDERRRFLEAAAPEAPPTLALCHTLAFAGCRISEALNLTIDQLDAEQQVLRFRTLKRRALVYRQVPVPRELIERLQRLAPTTDGRLWAMHRSTAWRHVQRVMERAGIEGPMACCKGLRHGFGIRAATCSIQGALIQRWMGHSDLSTTSIYLDAVGVEERAFAQRMW